MKSARGFTLLELLISVAIIAILSGMLLLSSGLVSRDRTPDGEASRILRLMTLFRSQAVSSGRDLGLYLDNRQLIFMTRTADGWVTGFEAAGRTHYAIAEALHPVLEIEGISIAAGDSIDTPHIVFLSDGQISPFTLRLNATAKAPAAVNEQLELVKL